MTTYSITYYMISMPLFFSGSTILVANVPRMGMKVVRIEPKAKN